MSFMKRRYNDACVMLPSSLPILVLQVASTPLCDVIGSPEMSSCLADEGCVRLIQCFLDPKHMLQVQEGRNSRARHPDTFTDPLYQLFVTDKQGSKICIGNVYFVCLFV